MAACELRPWFVEPSARDLPVDVDAHHHARGTQAVEWQALGVVMTAVNFVTLVVRSVRLVLSRAVLCC